MALSDTRILARALVQRWPNSAERRKEIMELLFQIGSDASNSPRERTTALKAIVAAEAQNQSDEHKVIDIGNQHNRDRIADVIARLGINPALVFDGQSNEVIDASGDGDEDSDS